MNRYFLASRMGVSLTLVAVSLAVFPCRAPGAAATAPAAGSQSLQDSGAYCGMYCLYALLQMNGQQPQFSSFIKKDYISNSRGSKLGELQKAAQDHGLYAQPVGNLTSRELRSSPYPIILHVKSAPAIRRYDHYLLCLGADDKSAFIYDPPKPIQRISLPELATLWDGVGLIVSPKPINLHRVFWSTWRMLIGFTILAIIAGAYWHFRAKRRISINTGQSVSTRQWFSSAMIQCCQLTVLALSVGILYHLLTSEGLLAPSSAVQNVVRAHGVRFLDKLSVNAVRRDIKRHAVVVDARYSRDYKVGHIDGAINISIGHEPADRYKAIAHVPKTSRIVLYCQSNKCPYASQIAAWLQQEGYSNLALYPGGWMDWVQQSGAR